MVSYAVGLVFTRRVRPLGPQPGAFSNAKARVLLLNRRRMLLRRTMRDGTTLGVIEACTYLWIYPFTSARNALLSFLTVTKRTS